MSVVFRPLANSTAQTGATFTLANPLGFDAVARIVSTTLSFVSLTAAATVNDLPLIANTPQYIVIKKTDTLYCNNPSTGTVYVSWGLEQGN